MHARRVFSTNISAIFCRKTWTSPAQATTYRPTVRRTPYNRYYSDRYGRRTRIVISDYYGSSYSHYCYYGG